MKQCQGFTASEASNSKGNLQANTSKHGQRHSSCENQWDDFPQTFPIIHNKIAVPEKLEILIIWKGDTWNEDT